MDDLTTALRTSHSSLGPYLTELTRVRRNMGARATLVGPWWGRPLDRLRATGERKWTSGQMTTKVLDDLEWFKLPALRQAGARFASGGPTILLFAKSGFKAGLVDMAAERDDLRLVDLDEVELVGQRVLD